MADLHTTPQHAATLMSERRFVFKMPDGKKLEMAPADALAAPWFASLPADDREHLEWWAVRFNRTEARLADDAAR